jgi:hypothetical protein
MAVATDVAHHREQAGRDPSPAAVEEPAAAVAAAEAPLGFGKAAEGASYPAIDMADAIEDFNAVHRSDDEGKTWTRINDDQHRWGWTGAAITGDPRGHGRVCLATNGRGVQYGEPAMMPDRRPQETGNRSRRRGRRLTRHQGRGRSPPLRADRRAGHGRPV